MTEQLSVKEMGLLVGTWEHGVTITAVLFQATNPQVKSKGWLHSQVVVQQTMGD